MTWLISLSGEQRVRKTIAKLHARFTNFVAYDKSWLKHDIKAGLSVAAVALPVAIAYAELAGVGAIVGLYSCVLR